MSRELAEIENSASRQSYKEFYDEKAVLHAIAIGGVPEPNFLLSISEFGSTTTLKRHRESYFEQKLSFMWQS